jgi:hypothetical protein
MKEVLMAAHATHPTMHISSGARTWRASGLRRMPVTWARTWRLSIGGLVAVSVAGAVALLAGFDSGIAASVSVTAAVAAGVLAQLIPAPAPSETLERTRKEAF